MEQMMAPRVKFNGLPCCELMFGFSGLLGALGGIDQVVEACGRILSEMSISRYVDKRRHGSLDRSGTLLLRHVDFEKA